MQTFLPFENIEQSLQSLDKRRVGKQRVEAFQIIETLEKIKQKDFYVIKDGKRKRRGWITHPAVLMWQGYEEFLKLYYNSTLKEWERRKCNNFKLQYVDVNKSKLIKPWWLGNEKFHSSHRANLVRKAYEAKNKSLTYLAMIDSNFDISRKLFIKAKQQCQTYLWYSQLNWKENPLDGYFWPMEDYTFRFKKVA